MKRHWVYLQLRFEAPKVGNAIASGELKWQNIAIIAIFQAIILFRLDIK